MNARQGDPMSSKWPPKKRSQIQNCWIFQLIKGSYLLFFIYHQRISKWILKLQDEKLNSFLRHFIETESYFLLSISWRRKRLGGCGWKRRRNNNCQWVVYRSCWEDYEEAKKRVINVLSSIPLFDSLEITFSSWAEEAGTAVHDDDNDKWVFSFTSKPR